MMAGRDPSVEPPSDPEERPQRGREWSGVIRSVVLPLGILTVIVAGLWWWDNRAESNGGPDDARYGIVDLPPGKNVTGRAPAAEKGRAAPDFLLEMPDGGELRLSDLQGSPVLVNFFASWCPPCKREMPELVAASTRYQDDGLVIVGVDLQEPNRKVLDFAADFGIEFPLVMDRDAEVAGAWNIGGPIEGLPSSYFIDDQGIVRQVFFGPLTDEFLEQRLDSILPERSG